MRTRHVLQIASCSHWWCTRLRKCLANDSFTDTASQATTPPTTSDRPLLLRRKGRRTTTRGPRLAFVSARLSRASCRGMLRARVDGHRRCSVCLIAMATTVERGPIGSLVCGRRRAYVPDVTGRGEWRFFGSSQGAVVSSVRPTHGLSVDGLQQPPPRHSAPPAEARRSAGRRRVATRAGSRRRRLQSRAWYGQKP